VLFTENGRFNSTENDSVIQLEYMPGLKYEAWFVFPEDSITHDPLQNEKMEFHSFLNGTSQLNRNRIRIQVYLKKENEIVLENEFEYRD